MVIKGGRPIQLLRVVTSMVIKLGLTNTVIKGGRSIWLLREVDQYRY